MEPVRPLVAVLAFAVTWGALALYGSSAFWWLVETLWFSRGWRPEEETHWGPEDIQVRILTIDGADVVQATVASIRSAITDVHVIAERPIDVDGATVHVVPEAFECTAVNKGRAIEWGRRAIPCEREYVLYLDEDSVVTELEGLPDADVIQFTERPIYTGSWLAYVCEVFRIGYQFEQFGFHRLSYPLYAWGGGVAIRRSIEAELSWDRASITEDTNFVWRAAGRYDLDFALLDLRFRNQAPPSIPALIRQRRRWISGSIHDGGLLPRWYRPLYYTRIVAWSFTPLVPLLLESVSRYPSLVPAHELYVLAAAGLAMMLLVYMVGGLIAYGKHPVVWPLFLALLPIAVVLHAAGAMWGLLRPVDRFTLTEKVSPRTVEDVNRALEPGDLDSAGRTDALATDGGTPPDASG